MVAAPETMKTDKLPPGMVLGPDGKPCKACAGAVAFASGFKKNMKASAAFTAASSTNSTNPSTSTSTSTTPTSTSSNYPLPLPSTDPLDCPANTEILGRHTWTFLHSAAAYYPLTPSLLQKTSMTYLLKALPVLYPCSTCATELGDYMKENPVTEQVVGGRIGLEKWLCEVHNEVNGRLGKEMFDCSRVQERWKDGWKDGRCD